MATEGDNPPGRSDAASRERLRRLSEMLDAPVESFTDEAYQPDDIRDLRELLRLWLTMQDRAPRQRILALARRLANL